MNKFMTSAARIWYPNAIYHITARGNRRNDIFKDEEDFQIYLTIIEGAIEYFEKQFEILCYCLMDNHIHILLQTNEKHLKYFVSRVNSIYAKFFNNKYNYIGHLYQDRYFSEIIESDTQLLETSRYIHLNPVRANMVANPEDYKWSSFAIYIDDNKEKLINPQKILSYFKSGKQKQLYKAFVKNAIKIKQDKEGHTLYKGLQDLNDKHVIQNNSL
jgi:REP element-mobilizing transposase RayT